MHNNWLFLLLFKEKIFYKSVIKKKEILIELVSERPVLYQKANKNYKDSRAA